MGRGKQEKTRQNAENVQNKTIRTASDPQKQEKRKTIQRSGDAKIRYPRLRLEINLRCVEPPVQTRWLSVLADTKNLVKLPSKSCSAPVKEED